MWAPTSRRMIRARWVRRSTRIDPCRFSTRSFDAWIATGVALGCAAVVYHHGACQNRTTRRCARQFVPYLGFDGQCAEAFRFYHGVLGGELQIMPTGSRRWRTRCLPTGETA